MFLLRHPLIRIGRLWIDFDALDFPRWLRWRWLAAMDRDGENGPRIGIGPALDNRAFDLVGLDCLILELAD
jgi:hypothetical protein